MKFLKIVFLLISVFIIGFLILIFTSESETTITREFATDTPLPVALRQIALSQTNQILSADKKQDTIEVTLNYFPHSSAVKVKHLMIIDYVNYQITLQPIKKDNSIKLFKSISHSIVLNKLADGSTNIRWQMHYNITGLTPRVLNRFIWKPELERFLDQEIIRIKKHLTL